MDTKITLKLNADIIEKAKQYARESDTSLSKLVENYLNALTKSKVAKTRKINLIVKSLTGVIEIDETKDYKKGYSEYLSKKYK